MSWSMPSDAIKPGSKLHDKAAKQMADSLYKSLQLVKVLDNWTAKYEIQLLDLIVALETYAEHCKREFCRMHYESGVFIEQHPELKRAIFGMVNREVDMNIDFTKLQTVNTPQDLRKGLDDIVDQNVKYLLEGYERKNTQDKIDELTK
jgi:hypothetical protein